MAASDHLNGYQFTLDHDSKEITAMHGGRAIGSLDWISTTEGPKVSSVAVSPDHRRQGVASAMYERASQHAGQPLRHAVHRTDEGDAWARSVGGELPARKQAEVWHGPYTP
jgi:GNAT superfamily N-acetyltransferase